MWIKKGRRGSRLSATAAAPAWGFDACAGSSRNAAEEPDHGVPRLRVELGEEPALLGHDVVLDPRIELAPLLGRRQQQRPAVLRVRRTGHVALAFQSVD